MNGQGILTRFGSNKSPLWQGLTRRFHPGTGTEQIDLFLPLHGIPTTLSPANPREASPTGKSGYGFVLWSLDRQPVESARSTFLMFDTNPIGADSRLITTSVINPWDGVNAQVSEYVGPNNPSLRWTG